MTYNSTLDDSGFDTNTFYRRTLHVLSDAQIPFLVGGSHAFLHYTGIARNTKDLDLFLRRDDLQRAIAALGEAGYRTERTFSHWLAKAFQGDDFVDLVYASGNGVAQVDDGWFDHSVEAQVLGMPVRLTPAEELIWQKSFIMERERFDGGDIMHLFLRCGKSLDWNRLLDRYGPNWRLLLTYMSFFGFVYPGVKGPIPDALYQSLLDRARQPDPNPDGTQLCRGTLVSRSQYLVDIGRWAFRDARIQPHGTMTPEEAVYWTWAIDHVK
ncbi:MAG TPA: hypothetical protein VHM30_06180 [Gemmatimonadaceae bacterium]|nr:hypothetical protein [Gemmatimonadaceae bacterium]